MTAGHDTSITFNGKTLPVSKLKLDIEFKELPPFKKLPPLFEVTVELDAVFAKELCESLRISHANAD